MLGCKKIFKVSIYPPPYEVMVEAVDRITAKQEAVRRLGILNRDILRITASTEYYRQLNKATCAMERVSIKRLHKKGYF